MTMVNTSFEQSTIISYQFKYWMKLPAFYKHLVGNNMFTNLTYVRFCDFLMFLNILDSIDRK